MRADFSTRRRVGSPRLRDVVLLAAGVAALIWAVVAALTARSELERARLELRQLRERAPAEERRLHELEGARRDRNDALANQALQTLTAPPARILSDIETALPSGARLEGLTLTYGQEAVELEIQLLAHTPETYDEFVARVEGSRRFDHLVFGSESRNNEMKVSLRADYRAKGGS